MVLRKYMHQILYSLVLKVYEWDEWGGWDGRGIYIIYAAIKCDFDHTEVMASIP